MADPGTAGILGSGVMSFLDTWYTNRQNQKNAREQRDWEKYMYQNRYQMQVNDLRAAGLNPMLAYSQSPGGVPTGATAVAQKSDAPRIMNESRIASATEGNIKADTQKKFAEKANIDSDTLIKAGMPELIAAQVVQATASAKQSESMKSQIEATLPKIDAEIKQLEQKVKLDKSNIQLNNALIDANRIHNGLRIAETYLTNARIRTEGFAADVLEPKARAAKTVGATAGHYAEQSFGKILKAFNPFFTFGGN